MLMITLKIELLPKETEPEMAEWGCHQSFYWVGG